jgi:hypothetical protein
MTEQEWLACTDPTEMMYVSGEQGRLTERRDRYFSCACCRRIWHLLPDEASRTAVRVAEHYLDGLASVELLDAASRAAAILHGSAANAAAGAAFPRRELGNNGIDVAAHAADAVVYADPRFFSGSADRDSAVRAGSAERSAQADLLRDIIGNPFRPAPRVDPRVVAWNAGTVVKMAQVIYDERRFTDLPILVDALEEAGCTNSDILDHCRGPGPHVRGCWVVNAILGKT